MGGGVIKILKLIRNIIYKPFSLLCIFLIIYTILIHGTLGLNPYEIGLGILALIGLIVLVRKL